MRERFRQFMYGRYGTDAFNRFLSVCALVSVVLGIFSRRGICIALGCFLLLIAYYRMLSRQTARRYQENLVFSQIKQVIVNWGERHFGAWQTALRQRKVRWKNRKLYRYFTCPHCRQTLRVPRGRGKVEVTCPKCHTSFLGKS